MSNWIEKVGEGVTFFGKNVFIIKAAGDGKNFGNRDCWEACVGHGVSVIGFGEKRKIRDPRVFAEEIRPGDVAIAYWGTGTVLGIGIFGRFIKNETSDEERPNYWEDLVKKFGNDINVRETTWYITGEFPYNYGYMGTCCHARKDDAVRGILEGAEKQDPERFRELLAALGGSVDDMDEGRGEEMDNEPLPAALEAWLQRKEQEPNLILYGPAGTGKTYLAKKLAARIVGENTSQRSEGAAQQPSSEDSPQENIEFVTFHPSFSYEDFVEGIRPVSDRDQGFRYQVREGVFQGLCRKATERTEENFVLLIDEINRANISKVFGELVTLLEADKRGEYTLRLPYSRGGITVPKNLFVIGTMNSTDRSIALMDVALRRRFVFIELVPDEDALRKRLTRRLEGRYLENVFPVSPISMFRELNARITEHLDRDHEVGHAYFWNLAQELPEENPQEEARQRLQWLWNMKLRPLLMEYFYGQEDKLKEVVGESLCEIRNNRVVGIRTIGDRNDHRTCTIEALKALAPSEQSPRTPEAGGDAGTG